MSLLWTKLRESQRESKLSNTLFTSEFNVQPGEIRLIMFTWEFNVQPWILIRSLQLACTRELNRPAMFPQWYTVQRSFCFCWLFLACMKCSFTIYIRRTNSTFTDFLDIHALLHVVQILTNHISCFVLHSYNCNRKMWKLILYVMVWWI